MASTKEKVIALVLSSDWMNDPTARRFKHGGYSTREEEHNPNVFVRPAAHGGTWRMFLDYPHGYGRSPALQSASVEWVPNDRDAIIGGEEVEFEYGSRMRWILKPERSAYNSTPALWTATEPEDGSKRPLRERAEMLISDPDLVIWLAIEAEHRRDVRREEASEVRRIKQDRIRRSLPLYEGVTREMWNRTTSELLTVVKALDQADGTTKVGLLLSELPMLVKRIEVLVDPELAEERAQVIHNETRS